MPIASASPPTGKVTLLFTDIVGSTGMWERLGDAFLPILQAHNAILTEAASRSGGHVVKTEGDSFMIVFRDAADAARCAVIAQAALSRYPWPPDVDGFTVRMAMHTGEPFAQGGDYFGPPVNRAARILSAAHGGQILLSEETLRAIGSRMEPDARCADLGRHFLKDLGEPTRLYQLDHPALAGGSFPPPRTLNSGAHNLPVQRTSFVGREKEIEQVAALLARDDTPVLALTGPGGIGKTRLSLQVAAEKMELFPDGVWFVQLKNAENTLDAALEVARTVGLEIPPGTTPIETVRQWLQEKRCLLILDDFGGVRQADRFIRELLSGNTALRCLATSRESLQLPEGLEMEVPELSLPERGSGVEGLTASESGRLFIERAYADRPTVPLNRERAGAIGRLLREKTGGVPAVIEKAADLVKEGQPREVLHALSETVVHPAAERGKELLQRVRESRAFGSLLSTMAGIATDRRQLAEAEETYRRALAIFEELQDRANVAATLQKLGNIALQQRDYHRALAMLMAAHQNALDAPEADAASIAEDLQAVRRALSETAAGHSARTGGA